MRVTLNSISIKNRKNCCNQMPKKAAKPLSTGISAPRGKYFYLGVNYYFDINPCEIRFTSKWGQTVDARFVYPQNHPRIARVSNSESSKFLFGSLFPLFLKLFRRDYLR